MVDWLISNSFAANRLEAVTLASVLMEENFLRPVGTRSMGAIRSGDLAEQFLDDSTALYTFVSWGVGSSCTRAEGRKRQQIGSQVATVVGERPRVWGSGVSLLRNSLCHMVAPTAWNWDFSVTESFPLG